MKWLHRDVSGWEYYILAVQMGLNNQILSRHNSCPFCGWRGYEREEKEGEREVDNLSTCGCVIQLYLWENTRFIEIREFGWGFLMLTS